MANLGEKRALKYLVSSIGCYIRKNMLTELVSQSHLYWRKHLVAVIHVRLLPLYGRRVEFSWEDKTLQ